MADRIQVAQPVPGKVDEDDVLAVDALEELAELLPRVGEAQILVGPHLPDLAHVARVADDLGQRVDVGRGRRQLLQAAGARIVLHPEQQTVPFHGRAVRAKTSSAASTFFRNCLSLSPSPSRKNSSGLFALLQRHLELARPGPRPKRPHRLDERSRPDSVEHGHHQRSRHLGNALRALARRPAHQPGVPEPGRVVDIRDQPAGQIAARAVRIGNAQLHLDHRTPLSAPDSRSLLLPRNAND